MVYRISDNIISPLGLTTEENYHAVKDGKTALRRRSVQGVSSPVMASAFDEEARQHIQTNGFTFFESLVLFSVREALSGTDIDARSERVAFILSTTKGNIDLLRSDGDVPNNFFAGSSAERIAKKIGFTTTPIVICNACISGLSAIIAAKRLLEQGTYSYAVVCGCDTVSRFVVEGFRSLQVLSDERCRPFDIDRNGLNLGEAAATVILSAERHTAGELWSIESGAIRNDAYHISTPSKQGEGLYRAMKYVMQGKNPDDLALINAHGTATLFNDQMEAAAFRRSELSALPVNALKGYFGHTMGAAGILETLLTMRALDDGIILAAKGFEELGVSGGLDIAGELRHTDKRQFVKVLSGFGGCNAALLVRKTTVDDESPSISESTDGNLRIVGAVRITPDKTVVDGKEVETNAVGAEVLASLYKKHIGDYPRFYKMDMLCRLGFIAVHLLCNNRATQANGTDYADNYAQVFFNHSGSIAADRNFMMRMMADEDGYSSPALFVYTLPNIVTGEVAMYRHWHGETSFYILPEKNEKMMDDVLRTALRDNAVSAIVGGWIDYTDERRFLADIRLYTL